MSHSNKQTDKKSQRNLPEIAEEARDSFNLNDLQFFIDKKTGEMPNDDAFKVLLKRHMPFQEAPSSLLDDLNELLDKINKQ